MERYQKIIEKEEYIRHRRKIDELEKNRVFCRHNSSHFVDVARIAMIINVEEDYNIAKDVIYAAALLHDIGRDVEYENGTPHEEASAVIASVLLENSDYSEEERLEIITAIKNHRNENIRDNRDLSGIIYRADKLSRPCYMCDATLDCHKDKNKRNEVLIW